MTVQSHRMAQTQDHRISLNANSAGSPLPAIPRRMSSSSSSRPKLAPSPSMPLPNRKSLSFPSPACGSTTTTITTVTPPSPPQNDSDSSSTSSSSGSRPTIRTKRVRGVRNTAVCPPEMSTPVPTLAVAPTASVAFPSSRNEATDKNDGKPNPHIVPSRPLLYTPGMSLRLSDASKPHRNVSESHIPSPPTSAESSSSQGISQSASAICETFGGGEPRFIRKKSGQLVKSSLKSSRSVSRTGLTVSTFSQSSKSEPTTPTSKAVHFDTQLEHVKLFLAEQKPLAVSRDGSPTDDTSGTDSDFPRFIFGEEDNNSNLRQKKKLVMQLANMPARINPDSDVALEELVLAADGTNILGKVRVRNLAYAKWVAVRFTFDAWQTTSEVTGKYVESVSPEFDRFGFSIRLNDLLARIEGKTLIVAVRFSVEGREMWDNNGGSNYVATFTKAKVVEEVPPARAIPTIKATTFSDDEASTDLADLKSKLEKVVQSKDRTGPAFLAAASSPSTSNSGSSGRRLSPDPTTSSSSSFRASTSFGSRYDLAASLKNTWKPEASQPLHTRTHSFPLSSPSRGTGSGAGSSIPFPQLHRQQQPQYHHHLGSPRDIGEDAFANVPRQPVDYENEHGNSPFHVQQPQPSRPVRNHQRGYFDLAITTSSSSPPPPVGFGGALRRTPPGTPGGISAGGGGVYNGGDGWVASPQRYNSFPPMGTAASSSPASSVSVTPTLGVYGAAAAEGFSYAAGRIENAVGNGGEEGGDGSALSTPSMVTPGSSRESTPSPLDGVFGTGSDVEGDGSYRHFLNKFCFFTGPGSVPPNQQPHGAVGIEGVPRTQSASDVEEILSGLRFGPPPSAQQFSGGTHLVHEHGVETPVRSPSLDDLMLSTSRSGSLTPTASVSRMGSVVA
ncbi:hypothetical protein CPC08DRAFT_763200 [Agrocybe pediades]|nr:hypothetical protein CPC08DRAFT_763200 [Agrocybe pediades]